MKYFLFAFILSMRKLSNTFLFYSENKNKEDSYKKLYNISENMNKKNLLDELQKNDISIHRKLDLLHLFSFKTPILYENL